ncbi:MAG: ComEC/Rec2 family competence protein [Saprospiraceae bacterium]
MLASPRELPLLKLALGISAGIFLQDFLNFEQFNLLFFLASSFIILCLSQTKKSLGTIHTLRTVALYFTFIFLGASIFQWHCEDIKNDHLDKMMFEDIEVVVSCISIPKHGKLTQFEGLITHIGSHSNQFKPIRPVKALVHIFDSNFKVNIGDKARIKGIFKNTSKSKNPLSFDYSRYLKFKHVAYQTFISTDQIIIIKRDGQTWNQSARNWAINHFKNHLSPSNIAIASALVLGHRGMIDDNLYAAFAQTGSMHVLAVSGLHVGIVSMLLGLLLSLFKSNEIWYKIIKCILLITGIWTFAVITGGSSSVVRASIMFSVLEVGKIWRGHYSVYNSIGGAALIMLLIDPFSLFHVGFQLSFSAILSIVIFYSKVNSIFGFKNIIAHYIWQLMSIATSVQILTLPISLYYFHQFPTYFFISGITAVTLATCILTVGIILLVGSIFCSMGATWGILDFLVSLLAKSTYALHTLPYGLIPDIAFDKISMLLSFVIIGLMSSYIFNVKKKAFVYSLILVLGLVSYREFHNYRMHNQDEIIIYDARYPLVDIIVNGVVYSYADHNLTEKNISFATRNFRINKRISYVIELHSEEHLRDFYRQNEPQLKSIDIMDVSDVYDIINITGEKQTKKFCVKC